MTQSGKKGDRVVFRWFIEVSILFYGFKIVSFDENPNKTIQALLNLSKNEQLNRHF